MAKLSIEAQAETVRLLAEKALPGSKAFSQQEATLLTERAAIVVATLKLFAKHEDAIRELLEVRLHLEREPGQEG